MNYLAHAYLSFNEEEILVGNMISDFVKGKKKFDYTVGIQKGIELHRAIDEFTDDHTATKEAKQFFRADYGLYAGAFMDVVYDHFLANDKNEFADENALLSFTQDTYFILEKNATVFPERFQRMFPHMQQHNWLFNYRSYWGTEQSLGGLVRRAKYMNDSSKAFEIFQKEYQSFQHYYDKFFPELKKFTINKLNELLAA